jgi:hypothetical protein
MRIPHIDDLVRLTQDIPELELERGKVGIVRSTWCSPNIALEVEFESASEHFQTRCLLGMEQITLESSESADAFVH